MRLAIENSRADVSEEGAWLTALTINGCQVLFEKTSLAAVDTTKVRGGCHVCLPNFGPGGTSGLPQHGFARDAVWTVTKQNDNAVTLELYVLEGDYAGLDARLEYMLEASAIWMQLNIRNNSDHEMVISPGFHPYFVSQKIALQVGDVEYSKEQIAKPQQFASAMPVTTVVNNQTYVLVATNLPHWIVWSDALGEYACVEPTAAGFSFANDPQAGQAVRIEPQQTFTCSLRIAITPEDKS